MGKGVSAVGSVYLLLLFFDCDVQTLLFDLSVSLCLFPFIEVLILLECSFLIPSSRRRLQPLRKKRKINLYFCFFFCCHQKIQNIWKKQLLPLCPFFCVSFLLVYSLYSSLKGRISCYPNLISLSCLLSWVTTVSLLSWGVEQKWLCRSSSVLMQLWINVGLSRRSGFKFTFIASERKLLCSQA